MEDRSLFGRTRSTLVALAVAASLSPVVVLAAAPAQAQTAGPFADVTFAEGNTLPGWLEYITILNPNVTQTATVTITYACEQPAGTPVSCGIPSNRAVRAIAPLTRDTVAVFDPAQGGVNGTFTGVGATLSSNVPIAAERPMYMTQPAGGFSQIPGVVVGAHDAAAVRPASTWYFPEGTTQSDFQEYLTLLNPTTGTIPVTITYSIEGAPAPVVRTRSLPGTSRTTIDVASAEPGALGQKVVGLSTIVSSPVPFVAERPLYFIHNFGGGVGVINGATDKPGARRAVTSPSRLAFAEGNGLPDFVEFLTILNTSSQAGTLSINYLVEGQTAPVTRSCAIGPLARVTVNVSEAPSNPPSLVSCSLDRANAGSSVAKGVAAQVSADVPITAERPMYFQRDFPEIGKVNGAHDVIGVAQPEESSAQFFLAEGSTRSGFDQFWTLSNPNTATISVAIDYLYNGGRANERKVYDVPASSRRTVQVFNPADSGVGRNGDAGFDFGVRASAVDPTGNVISRFFGIERPFYTRRVINGQSTDDGHDITGIPVEDVFGGPQALPPALALQADDGFDWGFAEDVFENSVVSGGEVTTTLRVGNGVVGQAGYTRSLLPPQAFLTGAETRILTKTTGSLLSDDSAAFITLPFPVPFFGIPYEATTTISSNGRVQFGGDPALDYWDDSQNVDFRGPAYLVSQFYRGAMPFWGDLDPTSGLGVPGRGLITEVVAPDLSSFAVQWEIGQCCTGNPPKRTFEVVFFADGRIRYDYLPGGNPSGPAANDAFIGLSGGTGPASLDAFGINISDTPTSSILYTPNPVPAGPAPAGLVTATVAAGATVVRLGPGCVTTTAPTPDFPGLVTCATPPLPVGGSAVLRFVWTYPPRYPGSANRAPNTDFSAGYSAGPGRADDYDELNASDSSLRPATASLTKTLTSLNGQPAGQEITFTVAVTTTPVNGLHHPLITDAIPAGLRFVRTSFLGCSGAPTDFSGGVLTCVPYSGYSSYTGSVVFVAQAPGTLTNTTTVKAENSPAAQGSATVTVT